MFMDSYNDKYSRMKLQKTMLLYGLLCVLGGIMPCRPAVGQAVFSPSQSIPLRAGGQVLDLAWAGGLNFAQFSAMDIDGDGWQDVLAFDRSGNRLLPLLFRPRADTFAYVYAPQRIADFPALANWVLLRDYNGDGLMDLFTNEGQGIGVYRQVTPAQGGVRFRRMAFQLMSHQNGSLRLLQTPPRDLPATADVDGDGLIDVLVFDPAGSQVQLHLRQGAADSLHFTLATDCWGRFQENAVSNDVLLGNCASRNGRHAGSTLLTLELNADGLPELLLGDISFPNMVLLLNGGRPDSAVFVAQDPHFPGIQQAINLPIFPAAFSVDVNQDGATDLLVSPNGLNVSENFRSVWYYENTARSDSPAFVLRQRDLFQQQMLDVGEGASPLLADVNADGLPDLIVGNYGYYDGSDFPRSTYLGRLALLQHTGTAEAPAFELKSRDWAGLSRYELGPGVHPALADLDADGDPDLLLGLANGRLALLENVSSNPAEPLFELRDAHYAQIDVGDFAAPQLVDLNRDGLIDLVVGEKNGKLHFFPNSGSPAQPRFTLATTQLGNVQVSEGAFLPGYSTPHFFEVDGHWELYVGSAAGRIFHYTGIDSLQGDFELASTSLGGLHPGSRSAPALLRAANRQWLLVGNYSGGLLLFEQMNATPNAAALAGAGLRIFPNPAHTFLHVQLPPSTTPAMLRILDLRGKVLMARYATGASLQLDVSALSPGLYLLQLGKQYRRWIKR